MSKSKLDIMEHHEVSHETEHEYDGDSIEINVDDPLGLLKSEHFASAVASANANVIKKRPFGSQAKECERRREANRKAAAKSRKRKHELIETLESNKAKLLHECQEMRRSNDHLRRLIQIHARSLIHYQTPKQSQTNICGIFG